MVESKEGLAEYALHCIVRFLFLVLVRPRRTSIRVTREA